MAANKKLFRSTTNRMFSGVCGGIAEYFNIDPTVIRVAYVALSLFTAVLPGIIFYIIASVLIPADPGYIDV